MHEDHPGVVLATPRLVVRRMTWADLDALAGLYADPEVMRHIGPGVPRTREQTASLLDRIIGQYDAPGWAGLGLWAFADRRDGALAGRGGLVVQEVEGRREVELGYMVARARWGRGLATEAALALRDHALGPLGLTRLISLIQPANAASVAVARRAGMHLEREVDFQGQQALVYALGTPVPS